MTDPDPYDPETEGEHTYECTECGDRISAEEQPVACPECGEHMRNISKPRER